MVFREIALEFALNVIKIAFFKTALFPKGDCSDPMTKER